MADVLAHKKELLAVYINNLYALEQQKARSGMTTEISIINNLRETNQSIADLRKEIDDLIKGDDKINFSMQSLGFPVEEYDTFIQSFVDGIQERSGSRNKLENRYIYLASLRIASLSSYVFIVDYNDSWNVIADIKEDVINIKKILDEHINLREMVLQAVNKNKILTGYFYQESKKCLFIPMKKSERILVFYGFGFSINLDFTMETIMSTILNETNDLEHLIDPDNLQLSIYNNMRRRGYVPDSIYNKQINLFSEKLKKMTVFFEPIISIGHNPYIYAWEALARDTTPKSKQVNRAPQDLFDTAELWGTRFQVELDLFFLQKSIELYSGNLYTEGNKSGRASADLFINVYPVSLLRTSYYKLLKELDETKGLIPLDKIILELSEKTMIPSSDESPDRNHIQLFRENLYKYNDLGIHFSVDDYGVGFASSSRLTRLGPAYIKVDRDILLDTIGHTTIEYVIGLARRMSGKVEVIIEGFDSDSKISLKGLVDLKVRYIQGHKYGTAKPVIDSDLSVDTVQQILNELLY